MRIYIIYIQELHIIITTKTGIISQVALHVKADSTSLPCQAVSSLLDDGTRGVGLLGVEAPLLGLLGLKQVYVGITDIQGTIKAFSNTSKQYEFSNKS